MRISLAGILAFALLMGFGLPAVSAIAAEAALASSSLDYVGPLPRNIQQYVNLAAGVSASAKAPDAARSLLRYLSEPAVVQAMAAKGLEPY